MPWSILWEPDEAQTPYFLLIADSCSMYICSLDQIKRMQFYGVCFTRYLFLNLHRQGNSSGLVAVHQAEDQDTASEMKEYRCRTVTGLHPLHTPHSNPDVHPTRVHYVKLLTHGCMTCILSRRLNTDTV